MADVTYRTLVRIAIGLGAVSSGLAFYALNQMRLPEGYQTFFRDAVQMVENHAEASQLLGIPISASAATRVGDEEAVSSVAEFEAKVSGAKANGLMHFWAERIKNESTASIKIDVTRLELVVYQEKGNVNFVIKP